MAGHIEKRRNKDGSISWRCIIPGGYGRGSERVVQTHRTTRDSEKPPKAARDILAQMQQEAAGGSVVSRRLRMAELLRAWLDQDCRPRLAPSTVYGYEGIVEGYLVPTIGQLRAVDLRPRHLDELWASEREDDELSAATIRSHYRVVHRALSWAVQKELVTRNVAEAARPPQGKAPEMQTISAEQLRGLVDLAVGTPLELWVLLAVGTAGRRSEIEAIRTRDLDLKAGRATIAHSMEHTPGEPVAPKETKTGRVRTVPLAPFVVERLKVWKGEALRQPDNHVCPPLNNYDFSHAWRDLVKEAKLPGFRFHDIRHSVATVLLESGLPVKVVQEILGHTSPTTTLSVYAHVTERMRDMAAEEVGKAFSGTPEHPGSTSDADVLPLVAEEEHI